MLGESWASPQDFATLFQYFWYRDFPIDQKATGARRVDWTIHIGVVVRNIADLLGLITRFERGGRKDAVLRSAAGDEIAIEWEWKEIKKGNELEKLKDHRVWNNKNTTKDIKRLLKYAVLITYTDMASMDEVYDQVMGRWKGAKWPLLLILIDWEKSKKFSSRREFKNMQMSVFHKGKRTELRVVTAYPWRVTGTRWYSELK